jgi:hypothetical protein
MIASLFTSSAFISVKTLQQRATIETRFAHEAFETNVLDFDGVGSVPRFEKFEKNVSSGTRDAELFDETP